MPVYQIKNISETLKIGLWKITETEDELLKTLIEKGFDPSTIYQTKNKQRLKQWLGTRLLLSSFFDNAKILYTELGKPFLDNSWKISISHSNEFVTIILNKKNDCGIDIEQISDKVSRIKHKFLNAEDLQNITTNQDLTLYWGAKEALYKFYGKKEVLFIENLFIEQFLEEKNTFIGRIELPHFKISIPMKYEIIEGYILTYTL